MAACMSQDRFPRERQYVNAIVNCSSDKQGNVSMSLPTDASAELKNWKTDEASGSSL
jgi:hypothetical protein